jgi:hypothetical protein
MRSSERPDKENKSGHPCSLVKAFFAPQLACLPSRRPMEAGHTSARLTLHKKYSTAGKAAAVLNSSRIRCLGGALSTLGLSCELVFDSRLKHFVLVLKICVGGFILDIESMRDR